MSHLLNAFYNLRRRSQIILVVLFVFFVGFLDYITGAEISISFFYLLPISLSAWVLGRREGIAISVLSGFAWFIADFFSGKAHSHPVIPYWNDLMMSGFFLSITLALASLKKVLDDERRFAHHIQEGMLPHAIPVVNGFQIYGVWRPAVEIGGDYYDIFTLGESTLGVCIADVTGHGLPAALLMSNLQAAVRMSAALTLEPRELCKRINEYFCQNAAPGMFITFFYAAIDSTSGIVTYVNAGHNSPLVIKMNGAVIKFCPENPAFGLFKSREFFQSETCLASGDIACLYTDGVLDVTNAQGVTFGEERLIGILTANRHLAAQDLCQAILDAINRHGGNIFSDDLTMVILKKE